MELLIALILSLLIGFVGAISIKLIVDLGFLTLEFLDKCKEKLNNKIRKMKVD